MKIKCFGLVVLFLCCNRMLGICQAGTVTFGAGANQFSMEFVTIGNPGNAADTTGTPNPAGSVGYEYGIGKYEVSRDMVQKFNASQSLQISLVDMTSYGGNGLNKPATGVSWNEAARFVNWLNTSTNGFAAYKFTTGGVNDDITPWTASDTNDYDPLNPFRSKRATFVLPSVNEWYKAAYYNPLSVSYFKYPTGSNSAPTAVASGTTAGTAVYSQPGFQGPAVVDQAGGLSPYGVMGLAGNAMEWQETTANLANSNGADSRWVRGHHWYGSGFFSSSHIMAYGPSDSDFIGFRVTSLASSSSGGQVPEPTSMAIFGIGALAMAYRTRRNCRAQR